MTADVCEKLDAATVNDLIKSKILHRSHMKVKVRKEFKKAFSLQMKDITGNPGSSKEEPKKKKSGVESALGNLNSISCEDKDKSTNPD